MTIHDYLESILLLTVSSVVAQFQVTIILN